MIERLDIPTIDQYARIYSLLQEKINELVDAVNNLSDPYWHCNDCGWCKRKAPSCSLCHKPAIHNKESKTIYKPLPDSLSDRPSIFEKPSLAEQYRTAHVHENDSPKISGLTVETLKNVMNESQKWNECREHCIEAVEKLVKANEQKISKEKTTGLTFEEALVFFRNGETISRSGWKNNFNKNTLDIISTKDILADDWEVRD